jgi:hypothetical protein
VVVAARKALEYRVDLSGAARPAGILPGVRGMSGDQKRDGAPSDLMRKLQAAEAARAEIVDTIARMLWETGQMTAEWEGGPAPSWDDITEAWFDQTHENHDAYCTYWFTETQQASALMDLGPANSMALATILMNCAQDGYRRMELDLWRKVERAKGFEKGSLTGEPGVTQRIAL